MVGVVQWLERQIVALDVVGSNPTTHPIFRGEADNTTLSASVTSPPSYWGVAKRLRHQTLTLVCAGSNPATPAN